MVAGVAVPVKTQHANADSARRSRSPQGQGARLRQELIAAADRILARTGDVQALSLRGVAREVGIAAPSIYLHFPDKSALVRAVLDARFTELGEAVRAAVGGADGPAEQLRAGCLAYCRFATEHPNAYRVLFGRAPQSQPPSSPPPDSIEVGAETFDLMVQAVAACIRAGVAPAADPLRVAISLWTALHGIVSLRASVGAFPWPPLEQQVDDAIAGLLRLRHNPLVSSG
jgi:AcrR family transcriptional regulator